MEANEPGPSRTYKRIQFQIGPYADESPPPPLLKKHSRHPELVINGDHERLSPPTLRHFAGAAGEKHARYIETVQAVDGEIEIVDEVVQASPSYSYVDEINDGEVDEEDSVMAIEQGLHMPKRPGSGRLLTPNRKVPKDPRKTYPRCYVEPGRRWTYKSESQPIHSDGELYYVPDPFRPVPPTKNGPCAAVRMHYAAQRIDSVKYRNQQAVANAAKRGNMESASCTQCHMRFFLPYSDMRARISYSENTRNRYNLPMAYFRCPICRHQNQIIEYA